MLALTTLRIALAGKPCRQELHPADARRESRGRGDRVADDEHDRRKRCRVNWREKREQEENESEWSVGEPACGHGLGRQRDDVVELRL
jgi:hypothetical protein